MHGAECTMPALDLETFDFVAKPSAGSPEENVRALQRELCPKIEALARKRRIRGILHGHEPSEAPPGPFRPIGPVPRFFPGSE